MSDLPKFTAAAVHADSVLLDLDASIDKVAQFAKEARSNAADIVVFPEVFLPGYPAWCWILSFGDAVQLNKDYFDQSLVLGSAQFDRVAQVARANEIWLVIGASERQDATLFNSLLVFGPDGRLAARHRKLLPIGAEKMIWNAGDVSDLFSVETEFGRLGGLICGEHLNDPLRYAQSILRNKIHASIWPAISALPGEPAADGFNDLSAAAVRHHAVSSQAFVINAQATHSKRTLERLGLTDRPDLIVRGGGRSSIVGPTGHTLAGPHEGEEETILYAEIDFEVFAYTQMMDPAVYSRPDVFNFALTGPSQLPVVHDRGEGAASGFVALPELVAPPGPLRAMTTEASDGSTSVEA